MAHHIEARDVQAGLEQAWHGKTIVVPAVTREIALPFEYEKNDVSIAGQKWDGVYGFLCSDDKKPAGRPMFDSYAALSNERFWQIVQNSLAGSGAIVESAGTLFDRCRRFITVKLDANKDFQIGHRTFKNRVTYLDSVDGTTSLLGINTNICTVCANTMRATIEDTYGEFYFQIRHTPGMEDKIADMEKSIESMVGVAAQFNAALEMAQEIPVDEGEARNIYAGMLGKDREEFTTTAIGKVNRMTELFATRAQGNEGETMLDLISGWTDFYSHESSGKAKAGQDNRMKQWLSSEYGSGQRKKTALMGELFEVSNGELQGLDGDNIARLANWGHELLTA